MTPTRSAAKDATEAPGPVPAATATVRVRDAGLRLRHWLPRQARAGSRYLDRPFTSVQLLLLAGGGLLAFGLVMATSTTIAAAHDRDQAAMWGQLVKEIEFVAVGLPLFFLAARLPPRLYRVLAYPILLMASIALIAVLIPGIGVTNYGARRWIDLGPLQLQPSELAKIGMLLWGADLLTRKLQLGTLRRARHLLIPLLPGFALVAGLIMLEPDLGTTMCFLLVLIGLLWTIGMPLRYFLGVVGLLAAAVTALAIAAPYRLERLTTYLHPFKDAKNTGFHTVEGLYALASGGWFGVGLGQGTSKYGWVPNANTDYVFAIIGEELGLIGCAAVLALFGLLAYSGMRISRRSVDPFARLVAGGATIWLTGQALINVGYVTGLLPVTGIPLPFISAGGTALLGSCVVLGMLTSFARHEPMAVAAARRSARAGRRSRIVRWCRLGVPEVYRPPRRGRVRSAAAGAAPGRTPLRRTAGTARPHPQQPGGTRLRPTGTDANPGRSRR
jgi:cell division protein FtsW